MILLDYSKAALTSAELKGYRALPSLGKGNHAKSSFSVAYYSLACDPVRLNVKV
ncbi:hypothetical protein [Caulobacter sp. LjRoot300]|uniref:hypothetical protein n=1 Tax=Caulobacter sp. LjRoot300 TaxID=3342321 RepID=UPI003ECCFC3B